MGSISLMAFSGLIIDVIGDIEGSYGLVVGLAICLASKMRMRK